MNTNLTLNARQITKEITVTVQIKGMFWVRVGMAFMKLGCWVGGFTLVDEFPMSLYQEEAGSKRKHE